MSELRERIARALWDQTYPMMHWPEDAWPEDVQLLRMNADAVIAALGLRQGWDGEGAFWRTPWERIEEGR